MAQELFDLRYKPNFEIKVSALRMGVCYRERFASLLEQSKQSTNFLTKKPTGKSKNTHYSALIPHHFPLFQNSQWVSTFTWVKYVIIGKSPFIEEKQVWNRLTTHQCNLVLKYYSKTLYEHKCKALEQWSSKQGGKGVHSMPSCIVTDFIC